VPKIISSMPGFSAGQVGSVVFVKGEGHTEDERMVAYFTDHPQFEVVDAETPEPNGGTPASESDPQDPYAELTDEQVAEAYATNVGGNATTRKGQEKALRQLDAADSTDDTQE
jgi:hypothetical protein